MGWSRRSSSPSASGARAATAVLCAIGSIGGCEIFAGLGDDLPPLAPSAPDAGATGGGGTGGAGPIVTGVSVTGVAEAEIAQGATEEVVIAGVGLAGASAVTVGDLPCVAISVDDDRIACEVTVPHGTTLEPDTDAPRAVSVEVEIDGAPVPGGEGAIAITPITASPSGDDATGHGTPSSPLRTLRAALAANGGMGGGDVVSLEAGDYTDDNGELWPIDLPPGATVRGRGAVSLARLGAVPRSFVYQSDGGPSQDAPTRFVNLRLSGFEYAVRIDDVGFVRLEDVLVESSSLHGVRVAGTVVASLVATAPGACRIEGSSLHGLIAGGSSTVTTEGCEMSENDRNGVHAWANAVVVIHGGEARQNGKNPETTFAGDAANLRAVDQAQVEIDGTEASAVELSDGHGPGLWLEGDADVTLRRVRVGANEVVGLYHQGGPLRVEDSAIVGSAGEGVALYGTPNGATVAFRRTTFAGNTKSGLLIESANTTLDLGTAADPGENVFDDNLVEESPPYSDVAQLLDENPSSAPPVVAVGVTCKAANQSATPTGLELGPGSASVGGKPCWRIVSAGSSIDFGP